MRRFTLTLFSLTFVSTLIKIACVEARVIPELEVPGVFYDSVTGEPRNPTPAEQAAERRRLYKTHTEFEEDWDGPPTLDLTLPEFLEWRRDAEWQWCRAQCTIGRFTKAGKWYELHLSYDAPPDPMQEQPPPIHHIVEIPPPLLQSNRERADEIVATNKSPLSFMEDGWGKGFNPHAFHKEINDAIARRRR
jgi:hypothetical protein